jgi:acyl-CoA synthetase (AMP-forming)/AMP-acid ligase II
MPAEPGRRRVAGRSIRWDEARAAKAYADGWWVRETLADALHKAATEDPDRVLIVDGDVRLGAATLHAQASALAKALLGRAPVGGVVSFMLPNWHEAAVVYLAATLAGMVAHPVLPSLRDRDLAFMLRDVGSRVIFTPAEHRGHDYVAMMSRVTAALEGPPEVVILRGEAGPHTAYADLFASGMTAPLPALEPDAVRLALYTSGTTGAPKGVLHSHNSLHALVRQIGRRWRVAPGDCWLVASPVSHIGGSIYAFELPLLLGTTAVLMDRWDAQAAIRLARAERCTHMAGATPFLEQLLAAARTADEHLPDLKVFICGGASVAPSLIRTAAEHFDRTVVTRVYGSTEVPVTTIGAPDRADLALAAETDGRPGVAEVKLARGEICVRGPQMLVGYLHPEDEAAVFDAEGFYRTGDLGRWTDGCLVVTGRAKDVIIRNGENISPKEVEDVLVEHPDIAEAAVVGLPDARTGERACAVIVPSRKPGPDLASLRDHLRAMGVAAFKIPEQVAIWDALPRNDAGKVLKHQIRAALTQPGQEG